MNYLNTMDIRKILFAVVAMLAITACKPDCVFSPPLTSTIKFKNSCAAEVAILSDNNANVITTPIGETKSVKVVGSIYTPSEVLKVKGIAGGSIIFGSAEGNDAVALQIESYARLLDDAVYEEVESKSRSIIYLYTFTDADYLYALENGQKLE